MGGRPQGDLYYPNRSRVQESGRTALPRRTEAADWLPGHAKRGRLRIRSPEQKGPPIPREARSSSAHATLRANEQDLVRRAAAWRIRSVGRSRCVQAAAIWELQGAAAGSRSGEREPARGKMD